MRARVLFLAVALLLAAAMPASAQFTASAGQKSGTVPSSFPSFFTAPLAKFSSAAMSVRPPFPNQLKLTNMMPSFASLQNSMLLRGAPRGPTAVISVPRYQAPPPMTKKN